MNTNRSTALARLLARDASTTPSSRKADLDSRTCRELNDKLQRLDR